MLKKVLILLLLMAPLMGEDNHLLFVIHAKKGVIQPSGAEQGTWTLELDEVDASVAFFSKPPNRKAGTYPLPAFLKIWMDKEHQKNAGFVFFEVGAVGYSDIPIEVDQTIYDPDAHALTFRIQMLDKDIISGPADLEEVTLFIDLVNEKDKSFPSTHQ